tara:strand:+ start:368 stop:1126 length:759 start_codon:yes stop_codon:yes gene_type:complete
MFNDKKTLVVFGDSNVWGAELKGCPQRQKDFKSIVYHPNDIESWPHHIRHSFSGILAEKNNMKILNLSIPGSSNDTVFRRVNKFLQGNYLVDLNDCFVMVFWTGVERREFYQSTDKKYLNYSPSWGHLSILPGAKKLHKIYSKFIFSEEFDLTKTFNYIYSLNGLLSYKGIEFVQGYSLFKDEISDIMLTKPKLLNFISNKFEDSIHQIAAAASGWQPCPNPYQCKGSHPTELGHAAIADRYTQLLKQRQAT